jgi:hypothetical protein
MTAECSSDEVNAGDKDDFVVERTFAETRSWRGTTAASHLRDDRR